MGGRTRARPDTDDDDDDDECEANCKAKLKFKKSDITLRRNHVVALRAVIHPHRRVKVPIVGIVACVASRRAESLSTTNAVGISINIIIIDST